MMNNEQNVMSHELYVMWYELYVTSHYKCDETQHYVMSYTLYVTSARTVCNESRTEYNELSNPQAFTSKGFQFLTGKHSQKSADFETYGTK